jgi:hypothetical protein
VTSVGPLPPVGTIAMPQIQEQGAPITKHEFQTLLEGAPTNRYAARRDVCIGMAASFLIGLVGLRGTAEYVHGGELQLWPLTFTVVLLAGFLTTTVVALIAHRDSTAPGGSAYTHCVERIRQRLGP